MSKHDPDELGVVRRCDATLGLHSEFVQDQPKKENYSEIKLCLEEKFKNIEERMDQIVQTQASLLGLVKQIIKKKPKLDENIFFPIKIGNELQQMETKIGEDMENYTETIKNLIMPDGLLKTFERILSPDMIRKMNYDGVNGKIPFKEYKKLNTAIFKALQKDGFEEKQYVNTCDKCLKFAKTDI